MKANDRKRIISPRALGAGASKKDMPFVFNLFIAMTNIKFAYIDHSQQKELLALSDTQWTIVRLPMLTEEKGEGEILVNRNDDVKLKGCINRESVARFILSILHNEEYFKTAVGISYR